MKTFRDELGDYRERFTELRRQKDDNVRCHPTIGKARMIWADIAWELAIQPEPK